jgi:signal transduction histidine kinase
MEETEWMLHLVDGLLTLARGEDGLLTLNREPVDLSALLVDAVEMGQLLAHEKPLVVTLDTPRPLMVSGSAGQLRQVLLNLISNAVKFTEEGSVTVTAREVEQGEDGLPWVEIRVVDTGVGIAPEELSRVFDRFYRGEAARARPGGTGLGLAIARLLLEQHGGTIDVQSRLGHGSDFRVLLPMEDAAPAAAQAIPQPG